MQTMNFRVGPVTVVVRVVASRPLNSDGVGVDAIYDFDVDEVYIYKALRAERREHRLRHEMGHAKRDILGSPMDEESACDSDAAFWQQFDREFREQGGIEALGSMVPADDVVLGDVPDEAGELVVVRQEETAGFYVREFTLEPVDFEFSTEGQRLGTARKRDCVCGRMVFERRIVSELPRFDAGVGGWVQDRAMYCDDCCHVQRWVEGVGPDGLANGVAVDEPVLVNEREAVLEFLAEHPEAVGVVEVA